MVVVSGKAPTSEAVYAFPAHADPLYASTSPLDGLDGMGIIRLFQLFHALLMQEHPMA
jgi:hypothetical protein